jgi:hypothetical protein
MPRLAFFSIPTIPTASAMFLMPWATKGMKPKRIVYV